MNKLCYRMECRVESVSRFVCVHTYVNIFEKKYLEGLCPTYYE